MQREPHLQSPPAIRAASTGELLTALVKQTGDLVKTEIALARVEARADIRDELAALGGAFAAAGLALVGAALLLTAAVLGLAVFLPAWAAALIVAGVALTLAGVLALVAWRGRVRHPLAQTQKTLEEDVRWAKKRMA